MVNIKNVDPFAIKMNLQMFGEEGEDGMPPVDGVPVEPDKPQSFKIGEDEYSLEDVQGFKEAYDNKQSWEKSYKQKDMDFAEKRKGYEPMEQFANALNTNPELYKRVEKEFNEYYDRFKEQPQGGEQSPDLQKTLQEVYNVRDEIDAKGEFMKLGDDIKALKEDYKDFFEKTPGLEKEVVQYAIDHDLPNVRAAFRDMKFDEYATKYLNEGDDARKRSQLKSDELGVPGGSTARKVPLNLKGKTDAEIEQLMINDPKYDNLVT